MKINSENLNKVYTILVNIGGAREGNREAFFFDHLDKEYPCEEWRFCGHLGFGGKYRSRSNTVDCYNEDATALRKQIMQDVNRALAGI